MSEEINVKEAIEEIKSADEEQLRKVIENWFERTRTDGLKIGAKFISAAIYDVIKNNLLKKEKPSLRDYKRCIDGIINIISVQLTEQNDSEKTATNETVEEVSNDE